MHQILFILTVSITTYFIPYTLAKKRNNKIKKMTTKKALKIEEERQNLIQQRISKGQEYKQAREKEIALEKVYKDLEKILTTKIIHMETFGEKFTNKTIDMKDVYYKIKLDQTFNSEKIEDKKAILDNELKKYLSSKLSEMYYNIISEENLENLTTHELATMIINDTPKNMHNHVLNHLIHAIINFSSNLQGYSVIWFEQENEALIETPEIIFDNEGRWTEIKTHKDTPYQTIFNIVYDAFLNKVMTKQKEKAKKKIIK